MAQFLSWLYSQASRAYEILGWLYSSVRDAALHAYSWAVGKAAEALSQARSFATGLRDGLNASLRAWVAGIKTAIDALITQARAYALELYNKSLAWINDRIAWLKGISQAGIDALQAWAISFVGGVIQSVRDWVQAQYSLLLGWLKELQKYLPLLSDLRTLLTPTAFTRLNDFITRMYGLLFFLVNDPLVFIYSYIRATFQSFLCFALAYGLGTVEAELPPWPQWGTGGAYPLPPLPPPGTYPPSGLVAPLSHLSISGYTFGPGHRGLDLAATNGENIYAMHAGVISEAGWSNVGYGFNVVVSGSEWWSRYAHAEMVNVQVGESVAAGAVIALANSTGNSTGPHLHLEIKRGGVFVDPVTVLPIG